ncbi:MAG: hypothetical protein AAF846_10900 [Chloroflexota bacterium]
MTDDEKILALVQSSIDNNRVEEARSLLRPLMQRNVTEAFILASRVAYTQEQALEFLRYALELEPDNTQVRSSLEQLESLYANQTTLALPVNTPSANSSNTKDRIDQTVALFRKYGWEVIIQEDDNAQFSRRDTMSAMSAFVLGLGLHIAGVLIVIASLLSSKRVHAFVEADAQDLFLTSSRGEMLLHRPQQAIIFLDKTRGVAIWRGVIYAMLGMLVMTVFLSLFWWQTAQAMTDFANNINDLYLTVTAIPDY